MTSTDNPVAERRKIAVDDIFFSEASPEQREAAWRQNGVSWAAPLSIDAYVNREATLSQSALAGNGGTKYLILTHKDDPKNILSACEVTKKEVLVADAAGTRVVEGYAIASVFTPPAYRGQGLAGHLLNKVRELVDQTAECGALYSDIGRSYYSRFGWHGFSSQQLVFHVDLKAFEPPSPPADGLRLLAKSDVAELCERDTAVLKERFEGLKEEGKTYVTFLPSFTQCSWHFAREEFVAKALRGEDVEIRYRGAQTSDGASWIYWDHDLREPKLKIMRIVTAAGDTSEKRAADVKKLLQAALAEAKTWGLTKVGVWGPRRETAAAAADIWGDVNGAGLELVMEARAADSIPCLRWKGDKDVGEIVWEENEYFAWC